MRHDLLQLSLLCADKLRPDFFLWGRRSFYFRSLLLFGCLFASLTKGLHTARVEVFNCFQATCDLLRLKSAYTPSLGVLVLSNGPIFFIVTNCFIAPGWKRLLIDVNYWVQNIITDKLKWKKSGTIERQASSFLIASWPLVTVKILNIT